MKENLNRGFSLVELIIVIAVTAILVGILAPQYIKYVEKSRKAVDDDVARELLEAGRIMTSDEEYSSNISMGNRIEFDVSGVSIYSSDNTISAALDEYSMGWQNKKVTSKAYRTKTYRIEFQNNGAGELIVTGKWQP